MHEAVKGEQHEVQQDAQYEDAGMRFCGMDCDDLEDERVIDTEREYGDDGDDYGCSRCESVPGTL